MCVRLNSHTEPRLRIAAHVSWMCKWHYFVTLTPLDLDIRGGVYKTYVPVRIGLILLMISGMRYGMQALVGAGAVGWFGDCVSEFPCLVYSFHSS